MNDYKDVSSIKFFSLNDIHTCTAVVDVCLNDIITYFKKYIYFTMFHRTNPSKLQSQRKQSKMKLRVPLDNVNMIFLNSSYALRSCLVVMNSGLTDVMQRSSDRPNTNQLLDYVSC